MFSPNAHGVGAINGSSASAPTPLALGLNVETSHSWPREVSLRRKAEVDLRGSTHERLRMPDRFFAPSCPESGTLTLDGPEAHHLMHVLRIAAGEAVEVFDGRGLVASAEVVAVRKRHVELRIVAARREASPAREVILGTAVPKGDRFDWLTEKATELGVTKIVPLVTARSSVDPRDGKLDKLRQTVITACKQCGRNHLLEVSPVTAWADFVRHEFSNRAAFIAHLTTDASPLSVSVSIYNQQPSIVFAIGPEGGFTNEEVALAVAAGAKPIRLGPLVLRIETAAIALATLTLVR